MTVRRWTQPSCSGTFKGIRSAHTCHLERSGASACGRAAESRDLVVASTKKTQGPSATLGMTVFGTISTLLPLPHTCHLERNSTSLTDRQQNRETLYLTSNQENTKSLNYT